MNLNVSMEAKMTGRNILADDFKPPTQSGRNILSDDFKPQNKGGNSLEDFFKKMIRESSKQFLGQALGQSFGQISKPLGHVAERAGYGALPAVENLPTGVKEGLQSAYAGLTGGEFKPSEIPDEYGAGFGRNVGHMLGQGAVAAPIAALASTGAGAIGVPALLSALGGTAIGFGATTPGNAFDRLVSGGEAATLHGAGKALKTLVSGEVPIKEIGKRIKNVFESPKLRKKAEAAEGALEDLESNQENQNIDLKARKDILEQNPEMGSANPNTLQRKANALAAEKEGLETGIADSPEMNESQMPLAPLTEKPIDEETFNTSQSLLKTKEQKSAEAESGIEPHEEALSEKEEEVGNVLGLGQAHRVRTAKRLNPILEARQKEVGNEFNTYIDNLKEQQVKLPLGRPEREVLADITKHYQQGDLTSPEVVKLKQELETSGKENSMPANKFVSGYRTLKEMAQKTRSSAYGKTPQEHDRLIEAADAMDIDVKRMEEILDKSLGGENLKELNRIKKRYATEIAPLFKNKFYQELQFKGKAPRNMLEALSGEPHVKASNPNKVTGQKILNDLFKNDPELLRLLVGESFAKNPGELLKPNELLEQYLPHMPELQGHMNELTVLSENLNNAKAASKTAKSEYNAHKQAHNDTVEQFNAQKSEQNAQSKANKEEQARRQKVQDSFSRIETLNKTISELESAAKEAESISNEEGLSLKEKTRLKSEAKKARSAYEKARADRNKALIGMGILLGGGEVTHIAKKTGIL